MKNKSEKKWIDRIKNIMSSPSIIPMSGMCYEEQISAVIRLIFVIFVCLLIFTNIYYSLIFLFLSFGFVIIMYVYKRKNMNQTHENFTQGTSNYSKGRNVLQGGKRLYKHPSVTQRAHHKSSYDVWNPLAGPEYHSENHALAGPPNPKTEVSPIVVGPSHDLDFWRSNNMITHSHVNKETEQDLYLSGQLSTTDCNYEGYSQDDYKQYEVIEDFELPKNPHSSCQRNVKHEYGELIDDIHTHEAPGMINTQCGYNPKQLKSANLPTNFAAGNCTQSQNLANYNKNLFTQTIQPGIYTENQVIEPINSNIGISFNQQFEPTSRTIDDDGNIMYTQHDHNMVNVVQPNDRESVTQEINNANVYDPRHTGYGTSYRSYNDDMTGQTRFMYDDINAIRMPNYITRSNIDFEPYADSYGPMKPGQGMGNELHSRIRDMAQESWLQNSLQFRTDLQERAMRKNNSQAWQQRVAPIHTNGTRMKC
jgi:hypothetical protein